MIFKDRRRGAGLRKSVKYILALLGLAVLIRIFLFQSFFVPTSYMSGTILPGDYILVEKFSFGARIPLTPLSIPFTDRVIPFTDIKAYSELITLPYLRIPGFSKVSRGDVVVFNYPKENDNPIDRKQMLVKRCIGLPGDTVYLYNKNVFVNDELYDETAKIKYNYRIIALGHELSDSLLERYSLKEGVKISDVGVFDYTMTPETAQLLQQETDIDTVRMLKSFPGEFSPEVFPASDHIRWNLDYFGKVIVPAKGMVVHLNKWNFPLWERVIRDYEGNELELRGEETYINNIPANSYIISKNYYFVLDDNRDRSNDSRKWGFVPEDHLIGKARFVWFSIEDDKESGINSIRWDRTFKSIE